MVGPPNFFLGSSVPNPRKMNRFINCCAAMTMYGICLAWGLAFVTNEEITVEAMRRGITGAIRLIVRGLLPRA